MLRRIIKIDENLCNGCGICVNACHEGAIALINGKAKLTRDDYCDGLGDCLPACPTNAISFIEKDTLAYDEKAVKANLAKNKATGCPGSMSRLLKPQESESKQNISVQSQLRQWPVQIKLLPIQAPYFNNCNLLVAADCTAFAYGNIHNDFIKDRVTIIGCPKLDSVDYSEKLTEIIKNNNINSITVLRMEVPCCGGIENAVKKAVAQSGKDIETKIIVVNIDGSLQNS